MKVISDWEELAKLEDSETHSIRVDGGCCAFVTSKTDPNRS